MVFGGLGYEFRLMAESSMVESFKACTTTKVRHFSASIFCFLFFSFLFFSLFFVVVVVVVVLLLLLLLVSNPWPWPKVQFCQSLWLSWWWWGFRFGVGGLWVCFELYFGL